MDQKFDSDQYLFPDDPVYCKIGRRQTAPYYLWYFSKMEAAFIIACVLATFNDLVLLDQIIISLYGATAEKH